MSAFDPIEPSYDDMEAYSCGYFPTVLLGNHIQWAMNYLGVEEQLSKDACDSYPRYRLYLVKACNRYIMRSGSNDR